MSQKFNEMVFFIKKISNGFLCVQNISKSNCELLK